MRRRRDRWAPPPPPSGPSQPREPLTIIELYPNPLPPPGPPVTRESTLADLQTGFASLTDDELLLARLWLVGEDLDTARYALKRSEKAIRRLWHGMRRKVRLALLSESEKACETRATPAAESTDTPAP